LLTPCYYAPDILRSPPSFGGPGGFGPLSFGLGGGGLGAGGLILGSGFGKRPLSALSENNIVIKPKTPSAINNTTQTKWKTFMYGIISCISPRLFEKSIFTNIFFFLL